MWCWSATPPAAAEIIRYLGRHGTSRVRKVVLIAPVTPYLLKTADNPLGRAAGRLRRQHGPSGRRTSPGGVADNTDPFFTPQTSPAMKAWLADQLVSTAGAGGDRHRARGDRQGPAARPRQDRTKPTLVIHGDKDVSAYLEMTGRPTAAGIQGRGAEGL